MLNRLKSLLDPVRRTPSPVPPELPPEREAPPPPTLATKSIPFDSDAQPPAAFGQDRRIDRGIHEMLGLCRGMLADGELNASEAKVLELWIAANPDVALSWPGDVLARRLRKIFEDGRIDEEERLDLADLLQQLIGGKMSVFATANESTALPLDLPPPSLSFGGQVYVFTGKFAFGPRKACHKAVTELGGECASSITRKTSVLVLGTFGSRDWAHTSFGRKIEKAVGYRDKMGLPWIVSEDHWAQHIR